MLSGQLVQAALAARTPVPRNQSLIEALLAGKKDQERQPFLIDDRLLRMLTGHFGGAGTGTGTSAGPDDYYGSGSEYGVSTFRSG